ncbi:adenine deaminase [Chloroflexi bacterium TSY]|nr:adenine deaminase [Chloroflexi bacterium TSY]
MSTLGNLLAVARSEQAADHLLTDCRIINVFSGQVEEADIAIYSGRIAGIGSGYRANQTTSLAGAYVAPGLIDAHVHIESSLCLPARFAAAILPHGVTCVVTDPHEIANVAGVDGIRYMVDSSRDLPLRVVTLAPSAVPATHMETNGASLDEEDLLDLLDQGLVHGLAEVMNFPGVVQGSPEILAKLTAFENYPQDGHAPKLTGHALNAYAASGIGSEHECTTVEEAVEKLARGFYILIREATNARNLHALLPMITPANNRRICFCTDDRMPSDLLDQGSIDYMVREAIHYGIDPIAAIRMATLNPAEWFGLRDRGAIAPGRRADLIVFEKFDDFQVDQVMVSGQWIASGGQIVADVTWPTIPVPPTLVGSVSIDTATLNFGIPTQEGKYVRVIGVIENQLITEELVLVPRIEDGFVVADPARDLLKIAVVDRHSGKASTGLGFIQGIGLQRGAIGGTVAHDHHNLIVIGADDQSMLAAAQAVTEMGGGLVVVERDEHDATALRKPQIAATLPLPVAGLMSDQPIEAVRKAYDDLVAQAKAQGVTLHDPFMAMSFMALEVIPKLKLTDQGLVDVAAFGFVDLFI